MNVTYVKIMDYENKADRTLGENEPNSNPIKANLTQFQTQYEPNQSQFKPSIELHRSAAEIPARRETQFLSPNGAKRSRRTEQCHLSRPSFRPKNHLYPFIQALAIVYNFLVDQSNKYYGIWWRVLSTNNLQILYGDGQGKARIPSISRKSSNASSW